MNYLLDTNVISELRKSNCNEKVRGFTDKLPPEDMHICDLTIGELCYGMEKLPAGKKKHELAIWIYTEVPQWFRDRIIPIETEVMLEWGKIRARAERTLPVADTLIASSAITHHMVLVTRNVKDFEDVEGINLFNPWE